jgi:hypothetical protein
MLRLLRFSCIVTICLVTHGSLSYAQERNFGPYFGLSGSLSGVIFAGGSVGWGMEAGMHFLPSLYAGLEYGTLYLVPTVLTYDPTPGSFPPPYQASGGQFWGADVGYVFHDSVSHKSLYLGVVVLMSYELWEIPTSQFSEYSITKSYLNIGPDFRYAIIDSGHIYLALAYTIRRGLKFGIGYIL